MPLEEGKEERGGSATTVMILSLGDVTLTWIALYIRVDKENSLESSLVFIQYLYTFNYLSMFTDLVLLHN